MNLKIDETSDFCKCLTCGSPLHNKLTIYKTNVPDLKEIKYHTTCSEKCEQLLRKQRRIKWLYQKQMLDLAFNKYILFQSKKEIPSQ